MSEKENKKCSLGMTSAMAAGLSYALGFISGIVIFLLEKEDKFVRFHAMQSIAVFIFLFILQVIVGFLPFFNVLLIPLVNLSAIILWLVLMITALQGKKLSLPFFGEIAEQNI